MMTGDTKAVVLMHGTNGWSGHFLNDHFPGKLFNPGQIFKSEKLFIIVRDHIY